MDEPLLRHITTLGVCCMVLVMLLLLVQARICVKEIRALRAHMACGEALAAAGPPPDGNPDPDGCAERHGLHAVEEDPELPPRPALRAALAPAWRAPRVEPVLAFLAAVA